VLEDRRCPSCHALVALDADWCGQCFTSLVEPVSAPERIEPASASERIEPASRSGDGAAPPEAGWPCRVCGGRNPIEADSCETCGTPFAALMRDEPERRDVSPKDAVAWSLLFPGLGHRAVGRTSDGVVRGVVFVLSFGMALLLGIAGVRSGPAFVVFLLLLVTGLAVYALSAVEAHRLASGGDLVVPSRPLLWVLVGVVFASIVMLALAVVSATRR
jgi:ribosomal protein L40E